MNEQKIKEELRDAIKKMITGVRVMGAVIDTEFPGCSHVALEVLFEEVDKLREKELHTMAGDGTEKVKADVCESKRNDPLLETVALMRSDDYKQRFKAEYRQTKIRYDRLHKMCIGYEAGTLDFNPICGLALLKEQKAAMGQYLHCLEVRAQIEGVELL